MVSSLAAILTSKLPDGSDVSTRSIFEAVRKPEMALDAYLSRLRKHFGCDDTCILSAVIYIDRIMAASPESRVNQLSIHRYLAASLLVSIKFHDDIYYTNAYYAYGVGVGLKELNGMEIEFLRLIKWQLHVTPEEFSRYQQLLAKSAEHAAVADREGIEYGK